MDANELIKEVRRIEIKSRALSQQIFAGRYKSAFKGRGMAFSKVRQYDYGDDVRFIDWNVTARFHSPYVKIFEEEREMTVMLLIDVSGSTLFGTQREFKSDLIAKLAATISFSAIYNNDKVGVIFFSDHVEKYIPPAKGRSHILRIIRDLLTYQPAPQKQTDITEALRYFTTASKKRCTAFLISDFVAPDFEQALSITANRHDLVAIDVSDKQESCLPPLGLVHVKDPETGSTLWVDTSSKKVREAYSEWWNTLRNNNIESFRRSKVDIANVHTGDDIVIPLKELFQKRG